jgi:hypothetical protein
MMATCRQCKNFDECQLDATVNDLTFDPDFNTKNCTGFEMYSNADRIRAMSDEEIYKFCLSLTDDGWPFACQNRPECDPVPPQAHLCNECFMKWLQQPVEDEK